jgi:hypothetical protein
MTDNRPHTEILTVPVFKLEEAAHELPTALRNDHVVWVRDALQARGKVRRLAHDGLLLRSARTDQVADDDQTRCDANARLQRCLRLESTHSQYQLQPSAHGALCVVLVGLGIPKVDQDPIAHVFRYEPAEPLHGL